jgi:hypothetical protein
MFHLGNGERVRFWTDWWLGSGPLCNRFARLFEISSNPESLVAQVHISGTWQIPFHRSFGQEEMLSWEELHAELRDDCPSPASDSVSWSLEPSGVFSTKSLYAKLVGGTTVTHAKDIWKIACPLKVRILVWQMAKDRLPCNAQIKRRHGQSDGNCALCHQVEDTDHIFFNCPLAQFA